jgi:hypothetical protein
MSGWSRFILALAVATPLAVCPAAEEPLDPTDLLTPPSTEPKAPPGQAIDDAKADAKAEEAKPPIPAADALKSTTAAIKDLYQKEYATIKGRAALVSTLIDQALQTNDDPAMRYALLVEARDLAVVAKNVAAALEACEQLAAGFSGPSVVELKRATLGRISGVTVVPQLIKLLDHPADPVACAAVGRWYAAEPQQWDKALPLLVKGSDQTLAKAATAELALTGKATDQVAVADQWYEFGKRTPLVKESFWRHALGLYDEAKPRLSGLSVTIVEKRIAEIEEFLPLGPDIDYNSLSAGQWEKLKGKIITVDAGRGINATSVMLSDGQKIRVVPHPTETWKIDDRGTVLKTTWKGGMTGRRASGSLQCRVGEGIEQSPGIIAGIGQLSLFALGNRRLVITGTIRVKIIPVTD